MVWSLAVLQCPALADSDDSTTLRDTIPFTPHPPLHRATLTWVATSVPLRSVGIMVFHTIKANAWTFQDTALRSLLGLRGQEVRLLNSRLLLPPGMSARQYRCAHSIRGLLTASAGSRLHLWIQPSETTPCKISCLLWASWL